MDDVVFTPNTMFDTQPDSVMDFDFMDELLLDGCWLQATNQSECLEASSSSTSHPVFNPSLLWPSFEATNNGFSSTATLQENFQEVEEERHSSSLQESLSISQPDAENVVRTEHFTGDLSKTVEFPVQSEDFQIEGSDITKRWWIGPRADRSPTLSVMERLIQALGNIKNQTKDKGLLIQVWVPVNKGDRRVLSTSDQPFSVDLNCPKLASYRHISMNYQFGAEEGSKEIVGLPGRVFVGKVPEWTPDVRFFRKEEYPRVSHAQQYDVCGTLGVPVFEQGSRNCVGVIEVVMTTQKINYRSELESVCKALEEVDLRSSEVESSEVSTRKVKVGEGDYQAALLEILSVLKTVCEAYKLPLAQTWVPCIQQSKGGCRHSSENLIHCISTVDSACYVFDPLVKDFHEACSEHHLLKGQGVVGKAFMTNKPCFSPDITSYLKTEYPLSHHARMFGFCAAVAVRLRSALTGKVDYVLEFFLPVDCKDPNELQKLLNSLSIVIQNTCRSLMVINEKETDKENADSDSVFVPLLGEGKSKESERASDYRASGEMDFGYRSKKGERRRTKVEKTISLQTLQQYFAGSLKDAAKSLGVCPTTLKRICRQHGIKRWPSRKIKKVGHSLKKIQLVMDSVHGTSGTFQIESFYSSFPNLASSSLLDVDPLSASKPKIRNSNQLVTLVDEEGDTLGVHGGTSVSHSTSGSQSSSSSHSCNSGANMHTRTSTIAAGNDDCSGIDMLNRSRSDAELHLPVDANELELLPTSRSHKSVSNLPNNSSKPKSAGGSSQDGGILRVKVAYREEKIRFRMQSDWGYNDLLQEIMRRFSIDDKCTVQLKYMDDDSEWVLLTCDADLEECVDIYRTCGSETIKLTVLCNSQPLTERTFV